MKNVTSTVLESHAYDNVLVIKYFCTTNNFSRTYVRTHVQWFVQPWYTLSVLAENKKGPRHEKWRFVLTHLWLMYQLRMNQIVGFY